MSKRGRLCISDSRGVTLVELMMSIAIMGMLLPVLAGVLISVTQTWNGEVDRLESREQAEVIVRKVESEVREGRSFTIQSNGVTFQDSQGRWIQYYLSYSGLLMRTQNGLGSTVIGAKVVACKFTTQANGLLLHLQLTTGVGRAQTNVDQLWVGRGDLP